MTKGLQCLIKNITSTTIMIPIQAITQPIITTPMSTEPEASSVPAETRIRDFTEKELKH